MKSTLLTALTLLLMISALVVDASSVDLEAGFENPPHQTKPWCYWYWISDNISREGITRDLEAMAQAGIGEALIGNILVDDVQLGPVKVLSEQWWDMIEHAIREGGRLGVNIGLFNCPGWSQSGGPWIGPKQTMRYVTASEIRVNGPKTIDQSLPAPAKDFQDIAVLAFPAPKLDEDSLSLKSPRISCTPPVQNAASIADDDLKTKVMLPPDADAKAFRFVVDIELQSPITARTVQVSPADDPFSATCEFQAKVDGQFRLIQRFRCDWQYQATAVGFIKQAPITVSCAPTIAREFRLVFSEVSYGHRNFIPAREASIAEISISSGARLDLFIEKQLGKMLPTPFPKWDSYLWPDAREPESKDFVVRSSSIQDLTRNVSADGRLRWNVPRGDWVVLRTGMTPTGMSNSPSSIEGRGLEVDKMNRELAEYHFRSFIGRLLERMPRKDRKAFTRVVADSYEMGALNWTDGFDLSFKRRFGYDPRRWLPVMTGRIVESAGQSERFLWDLRRLVADQVATEYVGGLRQACRANGLGLWLENYGHWGFPGEFLKYGSQADRIGGEFWVTGDLGSIECRAASSCANIYNKGFVSAESFTGGPAFQNSPGALKARGDWSFCEGVNHVVLHVYIHQPWNDRIPGINAPWGTEFNRHNTWFAQGGKTWIDYERRCCWLLQQGWRMADVAYFIGEDTPKMTGSMQPPLPEGFDFDFVNADLVLKGMFVDKGLLRLPHGATYKILVLPPADTMTPELLAAIQKLVKAGATVVGKPPKRSPSMQGFPACDTRVAKISEQVWGQNLAVSGERSYGKGRVVWGKDLKVVLSGLGVAPDLQFKNAAKGSKFLFTHRATADLDIYFVSNQKDSAEHVECEFRVSGKQPELWDPVTGHRRDLNGWRVEGNGTLVSLEFAPRQSWFVVFRRGAVPPAEPGRDFLTFAPRGIVPGPWSVSFLPVHSSPFHREFQELADWSKHTDERVRFYSGKAVYRSKFSLSHDSLTTGTKRSIFLNLGEVRDVASVRVNGRDLGTLWTAPWRVDVTDAAKAGENVVEIEITNPWNNRLAGDASQAPDQRTTFLALPTVSKDSPLLPAGLIGPVLLEDGL